MRVATFVLGIALTMMGETSQAFDTATDPANGVQPTAALAAPTDRFITRDASAWLDTQRRHGAAGAMGFVPAQDPVTLTRRQAPLSQATENPRRRYNPANIPLPATRTLEDHLLTGFVALMLIAYQLRRKHRFLRPHRFGA